MSKKLLYTSASILLLLSLHSLLPTAAGAQTPPLIAMWGGLGSGDGQLNRPWDAGADGAGSIFVTDTGNNRVQMFTPDGVYIKQWSFQGATRLATDPTGAVYVLADYAQYRSVMKFTGVAWQYLFGVSSSQDLAVDGAGNLYLLAVSGVWHMVEKRSSAGAYLATWGPYGSGDGQLAWPYGIAVDGTGFVYVADTGNNRIQKFTSSGVYVTQWGSPGAGDGQFDMPIGVAVDAVGTVYVADSGNNRIQVFTGGGAYLAQWGALGDTGGQFNQPVSVSVDGSGSICVADCENHRIQKFGSLPVATGTSSWGRLKTLYRK